MKTYRKGIFLILLCMVSALVSHAQVDGIKDDGLGLQYLERLSLTPAKEPMLVILIHGRGGNEESLFGKAGILPKQCIVLSLRGPIEMGLNSYGWYHVTSGKDAPEPVVAEEEKSRQALVTFIEKAKTKYHVNGNNVYLMGFSQGGAMAFSVGLTHPEMVKGIVSLSGRILDEVRAKMASKEQLKNTAVFLGHGVIDKLLPVGYARENSKYLRDRVKEITYKEYMIGHELSDDELNDVHAWFGQQMKGK